MVEPPEPSFTIAVRDALLAPALRLFDLHEQTFWISYVTALALAAVFFLWSRRQRKTSLKGLARYLAPARLLRHPSTRLDLQMYVLASVYLSLQAATILAGTQGLSAVLLKGIVAILGPGAAPHALSTVALVLIPVVLYLAMELGYWLSHYAMHRIGWMWEFHKVHHSAEVMTPLVEWRQHPLELFWVPLVITLTSASALAIVEWLCGPEPAYYALWSPGLILLVFVMTTLHLRHSHVALNAPGVLAYVLQSPLQHQVHHSVDPRHFNKNLGFCLSVWDWAFGTLYVPGREKLRFGVLDRAGAPDALMTSTRLTTHLALPLVRIAERVSPHRAPDSATTVERH